MIDPGKLEAAADIASTVAHHLGQFIERDFKVWRPEVRRDMLNARRDALLIEAALTMLRECMAFVDGWTDTGTARGFAHEVLTEAGERAERTRDLLVTADHTFAADTNWPKAATVRRLGGDRMALIERDTMTWPLFLDIAADLLPMIRELLGDFDVA